MFNFTASPPLSLYIHFPWCLRKCAYCDFNSHEVQGTIDEQAYTDALIRDLEQDLPRVWGRHIDSIYIGGGTPSLFSPEAIARLLSEVRARLPLNPGAEITLEANPGTVELEKCKDFHEAGVNRLSIGIQSFDEASLKALGRIHGREEALAAVMAASGAGFENINLDLMFGLPEQTMEQALDDVNTAIEMEPTHLSLYQLTIEPNTRFHKQPPVLPDDDALWAMQEQLQQALADAGYRQYEVSAYAKKGWQSRHNLNYWQFGDYLGIGAGAHGKISDYSGITRRWKIKHPQTYLQHAGSKAGIGGEQRLSEKEVPLEFMINALRLTAGFPSAFYSERTGLAFPTILGPLQEAEEKGLLTRDLVTIAPTATGQRFLNDLLQLFVPD